MEILDRILAYRLLISANLNNEQKQLAKATVSKKDYQTMKGQLKKVFTNTNSDKTILKQKLKLKKVMLYFSKRVHNQKHCILQGQSNYKNRNKINELHIA